MPGIGSFVPLWRNKKDIAMKNAVFAFISLMSVSLLAVPTVGNIDIEVDEVARLVKVTYDLSEEAVVTFAFKTNGIALPGSETRRILGTLGQWVAISMIKSSSCFISSVVGWPPT